MIENTNTKQFYPGPILNDTLEITDFLFNDIEQIKIKHSKLNDEGILIDVDLVYPTDYEVVKVLPSDINAAEAALTASTGQVILKTVNVLAGEKLTVYRVSQIIQGNDYPRTGAFPAASHEGALDYLTMQNQEQQEQINRSLKIPNSVETFDAQMPTPIPARTLKISTDGTRFELSEFDPDVALITTEEFKNQAQQAANAALASQNVATEQANIATQQATIATDKASEVIENGNMALSNITTAKDNAIISITTQETTSKTVLIDEGTTQVELIQNESATQVNLAKEQLSQAVNDIFSEVQSIEQRVSQNLEVSEGYTQAALTSATNSEIWAEGTDEEVQALGGVHSAKTWAEIGANVSGKWGDILGDIKDQTDLQTALDSKADATDIPDLTNYVKNTDYATSAKHGIIKVDMATGIGADGTGKAYISKATDSLVTAKTNNYRPLVPSNIDLAVKTGITTNTIELTDEEKASAKDWLGIFSSMPIGTIIPLNASSTYIPDGCLPCDGAEYTKTQFTDLWGNWLYKGDYYEYYEDIASGWQALVQVGSMNFNGVAYGIEKFVAVSGSSSSGIVVSTDGKNWTQVSDASLADVVFANGKFVAVGSTGIYTSIDGEVWIKVSNLNSATKITYGNGKFVATEVWGPLITYTSIDGETWVETTTSIGSLDYLFQDIVFGNGLFVALARYTNTSTSTLYTTTSTDGITWTTPKKLEDSIKGVLAYGNGKFVAVSSDNYTIFTSTDGITWTTVSGTTLSNILAITYGNGKFVAVNAAGSTFTSTDAVTWISVPKTFSTRINAITFGNELFVAVGNDGSTVVSKQTTVQKIDSNLCACSYQEYESDLVTYGQCVKFAVDTTNEKFRVPLIKNGAVIQQALTEEELGKSYNAGLPNITGTFKADRHSSSADPTGAFSVVPNSGTTGADDTGTSNSIYYEFNASVSNSIYGNSDTVQPNAVALKYFVVVANGSINQSQMDWAEWASGLQGKLNNDLSNCSKPYVIEVSDKSILPSWYRVYSDGWCEQGGQKPANTTIITFLKPFINTDYYWNVYGYKTASVSSSYSYYSAKTNTDITTLQGTEVGYWYSCGYIS